MAIGTPVQRLSSGSSTDASSYTIPSFTPVADRLLLLYISNGLTGGAGAISSLTGTLGLTWTQVFTQTSNAVAIRGTLFWAVTNGSPPTGTIIVNFGATQSSCQWMLHEFSGADMTSPIVQSDTFQTVTGDNPSITLAALQPGSATVGYCTWNNNVANTAGTGMTLLTSGTTATTPSIGSFMEYDVTSPSTAVGWTLTSNTEKFIAAVEIAQASVASNFTGNVALSGSGTLVNTGIPTPNGVAGLSGTGGIANAGSPKPNGAVGLSGSGSLVNTVAGLSITAPAALSGSGTLSFTSVPKHVGTTALSGSGTLSTAGTPKAIQTTNYSGSGTLGTTGVPKPIETMGLSGSGTLSAPTRTPNIPGSLGLTGSGTITYAGKPAIPGSTALSGSGTLGAVGLPVYVGSVSLSGSGSLTIPSVIPKPIHTLGLSGSGTLTIPTRVPKAIVVLGLSGSGTLDADVVTVKVISAAGLSGQGDLDMILVSNFTGVVALSGSGQLVPMAKTFRDLEIAISEAFGYDLRISEPERRELNIALAAHGLKVSEPEARSVEVGSALGHRLRVEEFDEDPA